MAKKGCCGQTKSKKNLSYSPVDGSSQTSQLYESRIATWVYVAYPIPIPGMPYRVRGRKFLQIYRKDLKSMMALTDEHGNQAFLSKEQYEAMQNGGDSVDYVKVQVESAESPPNSFDFAEFKGISEKTSSALNDAGYTLETLRAANEDELIELGLKSRQAKIAISAVNKGGDE